MEKAAEIEWRDGAVPVSSRFDDPYYSLDNGLAETRHVFLDGNDLPARYTDGFNIAELGFGTGLNFLVALHAFRDAKIPGTLHFTSFEAFPMSPDDRAIALKAFPELPTETLNTDATEVTGPDFHLTLMIGDARDTLPNWQSKANAWFLDGFSPAKNPELWGEDLMIEVARHTAPQGTFATYTAAGHVRRALTAGGFDVTRTPGFGRKRHMSRGTLT